MGLLRRPATRPEAVRGTGCGGDGSIGDVIPDGYWRGYLGSDNGTSIEFDLACVYFHQVANSTPVPDGWFVNNKTRTRTVPRSPGFFVSGTRYLTDGSVPFFATTSRSKAATPGCTSTTVRHSCWSAHPSQALPSRLPLQRLTQPSSHPA